MATGNRITPSDLVGKKFGRLEVLRFFGRTKCNSRQWWCRCECGVEKPVHHTPMVKGQIVSCGCYNAERRATRGGLVKKYPREYKCWHAMVQRCRNPKYANYKDYGGRGILVREEWVGPEGFSKFIGHIGPCPNRKLTLDRIDNDGNYDEGNVRWADSATQNNNRRDNHWLTHNGQRKTIRMWATELGINEQTLHERLKHGWSVARALGTPIKGKRS